MKFDCKFLFAGALLALSASSVCAQSPAKAEDDAYRMAIKQSQRGYTMYPATSGIAQSGERVRFLLPVTKGVDYVFLIGVDNFVADVDVYVFDEDKGLILSDRRSDRRAGVRFRASYTGTVEIYVHMVRANGLGSWAVLVGTRGGAGTERINPTPENKGEVKPGGDAGKTEPAGA
jgi:hypothetical protein